MSGHLKKDLMKIEIASNVFKEDVSKSVDKLAKATMSAVMEFLDILSESCAEGMPQLSIITDKEIAGKEHKKFLEVIAMFASDITDQAIDSVLKDLTYKKIMELEANTIRSGVVSFLEKRKSGLKNALRQFYANHKDGIANSMPKSKNEKEEAACDKKKAEDGSKEDI